MKKITLAVLLCFTTSTALASVESDFKCANVAKELKDSGIHISYYINNSYLDGGYLFCEMNIHSQNEDFKGHKLLFKDLTTNKISLVGLSGN